MYSIKYIATLGEVKNSSTTNPTINFASWERQNNFWSSSSTFCCQDVANLLVISA
jgi:hypothetical protein